jgi:rhodanese-related sulfurtransferase
MLFKRSRAARNITPRQASEHSGLHIVDVRSQAEWRTGHVPRARHIPLDQLPARLGELKGAEPVAFICQSGARSRRATKISGQAGIDAVNIDGGMLAWQRAGLPTSRR